MRLLLMCDAHVGNSIAEWLMECHTQDLGAVVTIANGKVHQAARNKGIPSFVFRSQAQIAAELAASPRFDLGILAWWPKLISPELMALAERGFINTHPSMLPYNRGKHYSFWALIEQAPFGVSLHYVEKGIDSGDVVVQQTIPYDWEDTGETLHVKAGQAMVELFKSAYPSLRNGTLQRVPQDLNKGSFHYANEIDAASRIELDRTYTARELLNRLAAQTFAGYPACRFEDCGETYEISVNIKRKST